MTARLSHYLREFRKPGHVYALVISLTGISLFVTANEYIFPPYSLPQWIMVYALVASVLILQHFMFQLPPDGNRQSMDSSVFLASLFVFGAGFTLHVLLLSSVIYAFINRHVVWWKHLINFSIYNCMIMGASVTFQLFNGQTGSFHSQDLYAYVLSLTVYFTTNVVLVGVYYFLLYKGKLFEIIKEITQEALFAYLSTLLLSLVLVVLLENSRILGLFLFLAVGILLSHAFRKIFAMYNDLSEKANKDLRTGLYSHSYFEEQLESYAKQFRTDGTSFSLALLDLDDFKRYNDTYGHLQGDRLLALFGELVNRECGGSPMIAARYGGEEFAVILPGCGVRDAFDFINGLRKRVNDQPFEGVEVFPHGCISFSAGIVEMTGEIYDKSQLVDRADQALYAAKNKGKNTVWLYGDQLPVTPESDLAAEIQEIEQQVKIFLSKDVYTYKHSKRVFSYSVDMAGMLRLNEQERRQFILGALIHDIGKLEIPRDVLNKKTKLTGEEWEMVKKHVLWGKEMILAIGKFKELVPLVELHHERYDGRGYPYGLQGNEIPRLARMLCIIDSYDAMTTERPYQQTKTEQEALQELKAHSGTQFDPELAELFIRYIEGKSSVQAPA